MTSRDELLARVKANQPEPKPLPPTDLILSENWAASYHNDGTDNLSHFTAVLGSIGGTVVAVNGYEEIKTYIRTHFKEGRILSTLPELQEITEQNWENEDPHGLENVELAIISAHIGVAENAALWVTESLIKQRVLPFICQQLAVVVSKNAILTTMHDAYAWIGDAEYDFGTFIAGPSKTADIEQSLVLGAHGPKGMTVFVTS